jgi:pyridoxamine 5'-phosphate oxidase family protein
VVGGVVAEHGPQDIDTAPRQGEDRPNPAHATTKETNNVSFSQEEIDYINTQPLARIASVDEHGQPDVVPVGFEFDGTHFNIGGMQPANTRRHRNILAGRNKVALVIDDLAPTGGWNPRFLRVYGTAEMIGGDHPYLRITPTISWSVNLTGDAALGDGKPIRFKRTVHATGSHELA